MPNKNIEEKIERILRDYPRLPHEQKELKEKLRQALLSVRDEALREAEADKKELYDALQDMFDQYCPDGDHGYISAGENAEIVLNKFASLSTNKE